jgi:hypothetical protein
VVGSCVRKMGGREWVLVESPKPSRCGSVSVAPRETAMDDVAYGWGGGLYEVVVVVGSRDRETGGRERVFGPKSETEPLWLGFGRAA